jgi:hypothetical protein
MQVSDAIDCDDLVALVDALDCLKKDAEQKLSIEKATQASMGSDWQSTHTGSANQGVRRSHRISSASQFASAGSLCVTEDDTESESSNEENVPSTMFHEASPNKQTTRNVALGILADNLVLLPNHYENEQNQLSGSPSTLDSGTGTSTTKRLKLSRWLAKIGIRRWKHQRA